MFPGNFVALHTTTITAALKMMSKSTVSKEQVKAFVDTKTLALVGASRNGKKFGNTLLKELRAKGYTVYPVHHEAQEIDGVRCYPTLAELPEKVGGVVLAVKPSASEQLLHAVQEAGISRVWLQQGAESEQAIQYCERNGMDVVHGHCLLMFADPVNSVHRVHRWFANIFGKLPA